MRIASTNIGKKRKEPKIELEGIFRDVFRYDTVNGVYWQLKVTTSPLQNIYITLTDEEMNKLLEWRKMELDKHKLAMGESR